MTGKPNLAKRKIDMPGWQLIDKIRSTNRVSTSYLDTTATGRLEPQPNGFKAFIPNFLPSSLPIDVVMAVEDKLNEANYAIKMLRVVSGLTPTLKKFNNLLATREAMYSCRIENIDATIRQVLSESRLTKRSQRDMWNKLDVDVVKDTSECYREFFKYDSEFNLGILSPKTMRDIHARLMAAPHNNRFEPGEFRTVQNWIGGPGSTAMTATFVPPPASYVESLIESLADYLSTNKESSKLLAVGLIHAQFEAIHPFLDGNGRTGRALITLAARNLGITGNADHDLTLEMSEFFWNNQRAYYKNLSRYTDGDIEDWLNFFLEGVTVSCDSKIELLRRVAIFHEGKIQLVIDRFGSRVAAALTILRKLPDEPVISIHQAMSWTGMSRQSTSKLLEYMAECGILTSDPSLRRSTYVYHDYVKRMQAPY